MDTGDAMFRSSLLLPCCLLPLLLLLPPPVTAAAEGDPMPRPEEASKAWEIQVKDAAAVSDIPRFTGAYVWRGRADRAYLAFHQWEFRLESGRQPTPGLRLRVLALGADLKPVENRGTGHWLRLGDLGANEGVICSYKLNTSQPVAYRVELAWTGGEEAYLAPGLTGLPQLEVPAGAAPRLLVLQQTFDYSNRRNAIVTFMLRNDGGGAATGVEHTVKFIDEKDKVVHTAKHIPEQGTIPAGYAQMQKLVVPNCPMFKSIDISTKLGNAEAFALDPGKFTDQPTLEIAELAIAAGRLTATVRNGTPEAITTLTVTIALLAKGDRPVETVRIVLPSIASGQRCPVSAPVGDVASVVSWSVGFETAGGGGAAAAPETLRTEAGGVVLDILRVTTTPTGIRLQITVTNRTGKDIDGLLCQLQLADGAVEVPAAVHCGDLVAGAVFEGGVVALGLARLQGLGLSWKGGVQAPGSEAPAPAPVPEPAPAP
jgi:hypothetical protein